MAAEGGWLVQEGASAEGGNSSGLLPWVAALEYYLRGLLVVLAVAGD